MVLFKFQELLLGDSTKARNKLGWKPSVDFPVSSHYLEALLFAFINSIYVSWQTLVKDMMDSDIELMRKNPAA